jgi:hypothetical protein
MPAEQEAAKKTGSGKMAEGRFFAAAGTALLALALLAGCSGGSISDPGTPNPAGTPPGPTPAPPAPPPPPAGAACPTTPTDVITQNGITLNLAVTRNTGVGPLAVFFDASGSRTAAITDVHRAFREIQYAWTFGENAAVWNYTYGATRGSRNLATGPLAAHIFEPPVGGGTQTWNVVLTATVNGAQVATFNCRITATDPDDVFAANTLCVSIPPGNFAGCPAGAATLASSSFTFAIESTAGFGATYKRILFRRGETFTSTGTADVRFTGPGYIGVFGPGSARAQITGATDKLSLGETGNFTFGDWRIVDLDFNGVNRAGDGAGPAGAANQITFLRCVFRNLDIGIEMPLFVINAVNNGAANAPLWQEWAFFDNLFIGLGSYGFLGALNYAMWVNNQMTGQLTQHGIRMIYTRKAVFTNNEVTGTPSGTAVTIRGAGMTAADRAGLINVFTLPENSFTEHVVLTDNRFNAGSGGFAVTIVPPNPGNNTRFRDFLIERNWMTNGPAANVVFESQAGEQTLRNNVFNLSTTSSSYIAMQLVKSAGTPADAGDNVFVYNNTAYSGATSSQAFVLLDMATASPANVVARNNLAYAPNNTGSSFTIRGNAGNTTASNNTGDVGTLTTNPVFANMALTTVQHWAASGYGRNTGMSPPSGALPVVDILGNVRPAGPGTDIGATELP